MTLKSAFGRFASVIARAAGRPLTFMVAIFFIVAWGLTGPMFGFSETWQLVVNTATTIVTFLMVFVLQNSQNRDGEALHAKLDELILVSKAENRFIEIERLSDEEIKRLRKAIEQAVEKADGEGLGKDEIEDLKEATEEAAEEFTAKKRDARKRAVSRTRKPQAAH